MVDGVILLVDAAEGPMPQTKFVTGKALALGLKPIVVVNKIDRPDARPAEVLDEVFELFLNLEANDEQLDFPTLYASGRAGYAGTTDDVREGDLTPLFETIVSHVPRPRVDAGPFRMLATLLDRDPFLGRILTGRIESGKLTINMPIKALDVNGNVVEEGRATKVFAFRGLERVPVESAEAGEIVAIAGLIKATVSNTFADPSVHAPLHARADRPADAGDELLGQRQPVRRPRRRQGAEPRHPRARSSARPRAMSRSASPCPPTTTASKSPAAASFSSACVIETLRREGFELGISRPRVLFRDGPGGREEPYETVVIDVDDEFSGTVIDKMAMRKAEMTDMRPSGGGKTRLTFSAPSPRPDRLSRRVPVGHARHRHHEPPVRDATAPTRARSRAARTASSSRWSRARRSLTRSTRSKTAACCSSRPARCSTKAWSSARTPRSRTSRSIRLKSKQLTNFRASGPKDEGIRLTPPRRMSLEQAIAYIQDDELVEVTPKAIRIRKRHLDPHERKRASRKLEAA